MPVVDTGCFSSHLLNEPLQQLRILVPPALCVIGVANSCQQNLQMQICTYTAVHTDVSVQTLFQNSFKVLCWAVKGCS